MNGPITYSFGGVERVDFPPGADSLTATYGEASGYFSAARGADPESSHFYTANAAGWQHMTPDQWLYYNVDVKAPSSGSDGHYRLRVYNDSGNLLAGVGGSVTGSMALPLGQGTSFNIHDTTRVLLGGGLAYANQSLVQDSFVTLDEFAIWNGSLSDGEVDSIVANMVAGNELVAPTVLTPPPFVRPSNYGQQWIRNNPFNLYAWAGGDVYDPYIQQLHMTGVEARHSYQAANAKREGIIWNAYIEDFYNGPVLTDELKQKISNYVIQGGSDGAINLVDEPAIESMDNLGLVADWIRQTYPKMMISATAGWGLTNQYIDKMMTTVRPDVLMYDVYPILNNQPMDRNIHFDYLTWMRDKGKQYNVPIYAWLQSFEDSERRLPSESELRMEAFSFLAAGFKGLGYYRYNGASANTINKGLIDLNGQPTAIFDTASNMNLEIQTLGNVLRFLDSTDIRYVPGSVFNAPSGLATWTIGAGGDEHLIGAQVDLSDPGSIGLGKDGMLGFFTDDQQRQYFMLVNLFQGQNLSADDSSISFTLQFDPSINQIWRLDRATGEVQMISLVGHQLNWTLPGGTGDLFSYQAIFVPEPSLIGLISLSLFIFRRRPNDHHP
ncbi:MAG: hypothetical protein IT447_05385 [Phycisphaerales bacterium]|nr:hypothetical protein [Phycisphaerales bacterium]